MIVDLDVRAVEIARPVLHVRFGGPLRPHLQALAGSLPGPHGPRAVVAGILAASHQVLVDGEVVETVTCDDPTGAPVTAGTVIDRRDLQFRSSVRHLAPAPFVQAVDALVAGCTTTAALAARFPNDDRAVTAVVLGDRGWRTTHTYPRPGGGGVIVTTTTELA